MPPYYTLTRLVLPVAALLLVHAALRMAYAGSVEPDDADLILFSQRLAWGYSDQAPLYSWLCEIAFAGFGVGVVAITVVRTVVLAVTVWLLDAAAQLVCPDRRLALLATYSVLLIPSLSWHALAYLTHTNLVLALCAATLFSFLRILRDARTLDYLLFGAACGLGLITKYTFVWFAVGLIVAGLTLAEGRRRVLDWRTLLAASVCLVILAPHLVWLKQYGDTVREILAIKTTRMELKDASYLTRVQRGLWDAGSAAVLIALPVAWLVSLLFHPSVRSITTLFKYRRWRQLMRLYITGLTRSSPDTDASRVMFRKLLGRFFVAVIGLVMLQVFVIGAGRFHERWLQPFAVVFPLWLFARLDALAIQRNTVKGFVGLLAFFAVGYTVARAVQVGWFVDKPRGAYPMRLDFRELAKQIAAEAGESPAVLTPEREVGGNLLLQLPHAKVACTCHPAYPIDLGRGPIVIAWNPGPFGNQPPWLLLDKEHKRWATRPIIVEDRVRRVEVAPSYKDGPPTVVAFVVIPASQ